MALSSHSKASRPSEGAGSPGPHAHGLLHGETVHEKGPGMASPPGAQRGRKGKCCLSADTSVPCQGGREVRWHPTRGSTTSGSGRLAFPRDLSAQNRRVGIWTCDLYDALVPGRTLDVRTPERAPARGCGHGRAVWSLSSHTGSRLAGHPPGSTCSASGVGSVPHLRPREAVGRRRHRFRSEVLHAEVTFRLGHKSRSASATVRSCGPWRVRGACHVHCAPRRDFHAWAERLA